MDDRPQFGRCSKDNEMSNENAKARKEVLNATSVIVGFYFCTRRRHCRLLSFLNIRREKYYELYLRSINTTFLSFPLQKQTVLVITREATCNTMYHFKIALLNSVQCFVLPWRFYATRVGHLTCYWAGCMT